MLGVMWCREAQPSSVRSNCVEWPAVACDRSSEATSIVGNEEREHCCVEVKQMLSKGDFHFTADDILISD